jgi:cytochrome c oxidase accessory protein FixG
MARPSLKLVSPQQGAQTPAAREGASGEQQLYQAAAKIYPRAVSGWFAAWRWTLVWATQLVFYGGAWLSWKGRQALLFDIAERKFYVFGLVFWPQDVIYLTVLLIVSALALFLFTAVAGRLWCGYACPQTVYTEIFLWIERLVEGDRSRRIVLDRAPWSARKLAIKALKHGAWGAVALWTGFTFVGYFTPIRELAAEVASLGAWLAGGASPALGPWESFWILFYGFATYGNAGWMREQVCIYMCPYARFQSAMFDKDTLIITYDRERGEPRGARPKGTDSKSRGLGDCVSCGVCVQVCPTGIDIRDGLQYQCIGCAACIDGCNQVMDRMRYARGLIRYSTQHAMERKLTRARTFARALRPRVLVYSAILAAVVAAAAAGLYLRMPLKVDVIRDRVAIAREVEGGLIENVYRLQIMNAAEQARVFEIRAEGVPTLALAGEPRVAVGATASRLVTVRLRVQPGALPAGSHRIDFGVRALGVQDVQVREKSVFVVR